MNALFWHVPSSSEAHGGQELQAAGTESRGALLAVPQCPTGPTEQPHALLSQELSRYLPVEVQQGDVCLGSQVGTQNTFSHGKHVLLGIGFWPAEQ